MSSCFLFLVSLGRGRVLGLVWHLLCPVSRGVMSVTWYQCLSPTPHRLQVALVSFLPRLQSFSLSSLGALCSCGLFDSASPLSASSAPCSSSEKLRPQGHQYFRCVWWDRDGVGDGLPACPATTPIILSPEWIIHIYEVERKDTRMIRKCCSLSWSLVQGVLGLHFP